MIGINYARTQVTQWDFQNKGTGTSPAWLSFVLKVPLRYLSPSIINSVPWDQIIQRASCAKCVVYFALSYIAPPSPSKLGRQHTILFSEGARKPHTADAVRGATVHIGYAGSSRSYAIDTFTLNLTNRSPTKPSLGGRWSRRAALSFFRFWVTNINVEFTPCSISTHSEWYRHASCDRSWWWWFWHSYERSILQI